MRKVFEHPAFHEVGLCESILNSRGIATTIRNQDVSSLTGEVPFTHAFPELWILDDTQYGDAIAVLQEFRAGADQSAPGLDWICAKCGESVPGNFASCWKCDSPAPAN